MCEPTTIIAAATAVSGVFSAYSQYQQGKNQADVAEYNASVAENDAQQVQNESVDAENAQRQKVVQLLSKQRAQLGAANVDLSSGSALQIQGDTIEQGEIDALRIRNNYDYKVDSLYNEASALRGEASAASSMGVTSAFGTLLGTGASVIGTGVADKWFTSSSSLSATANQGQSVTGTSYVPSF